MNEEPLQYMPMEKWEELQKIFASDWPRSLSAHAALQTQKEIETLGLGYGFKVYCPYGDPVNGIVAMNKKGNFNEIIIYCPPKSIMKLENCLLSTKLVKWTDPIIMPFLPEYIFETMKRIAPILNMNIEPDHPPHKVVLLDKKTPLFENITIQEDISFEQLMEEHVNTVDRVWINRYDGSISIFKLLTKAKFGYGLFRNKTLLSSVFVNEVGAITHMYTFENYRNKGYGKTLLQLVCNELLKRGKHVFGYCNIENTVALNIYKYLGFQGELMEIIIQCPQNDTTKLKEALINTKLIDWNNVILIPFMPEHIQHSVSEVATQVNVEMVAEDTVPNQMFILDKSTPLFDEISTPQDVTIRPVTVNELEIVNTTWRNRYNGSVWLFNTLAKANFGFGLFKNHELISWVFISEVGALTHLFTSTEHRRMGYVEILLKHLCNTRLRENKHVFAYCRKGNEGARKLYEKLGFDEHHEVRWCFLKPIIK